MSRRSARVQNADSSAATAGIGADDSATDDEAGSSEEETAVRKMKWSRKRRDWLIAQKRPEYGACKDLVSTQKWWNEQDNDALAAMAAEMKTWTAVPPNHWAEDNEDNDRDGWQQMSGAEQRAASAKTKPKTKRAGSFHLCACAARYCCRLGCACTN